ncbi:MAG: nucleotidyltransferase domain-containing protein [Chitinispirillales bacterium]|nr:nucleotidyltransferase domain-containing protein [Chitinispirillales bacterium]
MDKEQALSIAEKYAEKVAKEFKPKQILLFGSYLYGTPNEYSDIDIAVIFDEYNGPGSWWDGAARMQAIRREINDTDIEPHLMELNHDYSGFAHHIQKIGKILYPQNIT